MATSSSLSNFLSFILPTKPPPPKTPPPPQLNLPSSSTTRFPSQTQNSPHNLVPQVSQDDNFSSLSADLSSVICPSLAYANTLFFKSAYNVQVLVAENESEERLVNRFRREVMKTGLIQECKRRRFFENKQDEKKRRSRDAAKRNRRRRPMSRFSTESKQEIPTAKKEEEEDNWDLPEVDAP